MSLNCSTDANPTAHMYYFYSSSNLSGNSSSSVFNITVETDGLYTCVPVNTVGAGDNASISITAVGKCSSFIHILCLQSFEWNGKVLRQRLKTKLLVSSGTN